MRLTEEGMKKLSGLIDGKMRMLLDWTDFVEDAGVPVNILQGYLNRERDEVPEKYLKGLEYALGMRYGELFRRLSWEIPDNVELDADT